MLLTVPDHETEGIEGRKAWIERYINSRRVCFSIFLQPLPLLSPLPPECQNHRHVPPHPVLLTLLSLGIVTLWHQASNEIPVEKCNFKSHVLTCDICKCGVLVALWSVQTCHGFGSRSESSQEEPGSKLAELISEDFVSFFKESTKENSNLTQQMICSFLKNFSPRLFIGSVCWTLLQILWVLKWINNLLIV